ncbi:hypothetical protein QJS04_geneDACA011185 [Acorus gramineus]|uniref:Uncharacterized protein n=1 Tax=Acorus gramineus TaxID=55184 RepID=A0AAV9ALB4_ACOGR|nr:hypothetical protein QJS04_geneDACA011185 [Acorus gramineus]
MEMDLDKQGTVFLGGGETSLSLSLSEIFSIKDGSIAPVLKVSVPICPCLSSGAGDGVAPEYRFLGPDIVSFTLYSCCGI